MDYSGARILRGDILGEVFSLPKAISLTSQILRAILNELNELGKILIIVGLGIAAIGFLIRNGFGKGWLGRLPGDVHWSSGNFNLHFPIVTCILASLILTAVLWFFRR